MNLLMKSRSLQRRIACEKRRGESQNMVPSTPPLGQLLRSKVPACLLALNLQRYKTKRWKTSNIPTPMAHHGSSNLSWLLSHLKTGEKHLENMSNGRSPLPQSMIQNQMQYRIGPNPPTALRPLSTGFKSRVTLPSMSLGRGPRTGD
ncbi:hypothetical protein M9H77_21622 [Catharanthus roseus]|uniref:Uncharacterized protein n=1 Tax=Catharanthus roseus TaxID=4058 RepID=A0ACC0ANZ1_CATRO|nr:hypothetical protein M9H77_21622 [Catharanthus roseus]